MIKDADKQAFIMNALRADNWDKDEVWIGATDLQHEDDWRWVDGMLHIDIYSYIFRLCSFTYTNDAKIIHIFNDHLIKNY